MDAAAAGVSLGAWAWGQVGQSGRTPWFTHPNRPTLQTGMGLGHHPEHLTAAAFLPARSGVADKKGEKANGIFTTIRVPPVQIPRFS